MLKCPNITSVISTFSWGRGGGKFVVIFQCHWTIEKLEKNSTLYVIIHSSLLSFLFSLFSFFLFFFYSFSCFLLPAGGATPPSPHQMTPLPNISRVVKHECKSLLIVS